PDIRLPIDVIRASSGKSGGASPLKEHIRRHDQEQKAETAKGVKGKPGARAPGAPSGSPAGGIAARGRKKVEMVSGGEDELKAKLGGREARQLSRKRVANKKRGEDDDLPIGNAPPPRRAPSKLNRVLHGSTAAPRKTKVICELPCTVRSFSEAIGLPARMVQ